MAHAEKSIVVRVPVRAAFRCWTDWERLPEFLDGVRSVTARDDTTQEWDVELAGQAMRWETQVEARDERHVSWHTTGAPHAQGDVELKPVEGGQALVTLRLSYEPPAEHDTEGATGMVDRMVIASLERFKTWAEAREPRRLADDDAPPPRGAETVDGPEGEQGGPLDPDAGALPFDENHREGRAFDLDAAEHPEGEGDVNLDDNEAEWSRTRP